MILRLALRNLLHDRIRFAATLVGLVFSTSLVTIQLGLYTSSERMIATLIDRSEADLWIVPLETRSFENGATLPGRERHLALSTPGIAAATEVVVSFAEWRKPSGGVVPVVLVGAEPHGGALGRRVVERCQTQQDMRLAVTPGDQLGPQNRAEVSRLSRRGYEGRQLVGTPLPTKILMQHTTVGANRAACALRQVRQWQYTIGLSS